MTPLHVIYVLFIVIFTKEGPSPIAKYFDNAFNCQVSEASLLTDAEKDKKVIGWQVPVECVRVEEANKI